MIVIIANPVLGDTPMGRSIGEKVGSAVGVASVAAVPAVADAAIVHVQGTPISVAMSDVGTGWLVPWDVDGIGPEEFRIGISYYDAGFRHRFGWVGQAVNGRGFVNSISEDENAIGALPAGMTVGATLEPGYYLGRGFGIWALASFSHVTKIPSTFSFPGHVLGDNFVGFAFDPGDGLHYGWAVFSFAEAGLNNRDSSITIKEWAYNTTPGAPILVGQVPLLPSILPAITLLGLGAAGARAWRRRRAEKQNHL